MFDSLIENPVDGQAVISAVFRINFLLRKKSTKGTLGLDTIAILRLPIITPKVR
jgi:hypothetical protein